MLTPFEYDVLYLRCCVFAAKDTLEPFDTRKLADKLGTSINAIARAVRSLRSGGYLDQHHNPTLAGRQMVNEPQVFAAKFNTYRSKFFSIQKVDNL
ncbi:hypothetical protein [Larkinella sp.]|uniref:hypothetical protein n=1 Tax=Larkinella sp. TaxID=2034517 RepID=UPI003BAC0067